MIAAVGTVLSTVVSRDGAEADVAGRVRHPDAQVVGAVARDRSCRASPARRPPCRCRTSSTRRRRRASAGTRRSSMPEPPSEPVALRLTAAPRITAGGAVSVATGAVSSTRTPAATALTPTLSGAVRHAHAQVVEAVGERPGVERAVRRGSGVGVERRPRAGTRDGPLELDQVEPGAARVGSGRLERHGGAVDRRGRRRQHARRQRAVDEHAGDDDRVGGEPGGVGDARVDVVAAVGRRPRDAPGRPARSRCRSTSRTAGRSARGRTPRSRRPSPHRPPRR